MVLSDWCVCPTCSFPALLSQFIKLVLSVPATISVYYVLVIHLYLVFRLLDTTDSTCPMCRNKVNSESLNKLDHPNLQHIHDEE